MSEKSISDLLRAAANCLDGMETTTNNRPPPRAAEVGTPSTRTPVQAEVARLFAPYSARPARPTTTMAPPAKRLCRTTYTHTFFCLSDHMGDKVPAKSAKLELTAAGLGEKRIAFQVREEDHKSFRDKIEEVFPQLKETGGFQLLRISGTTRSRDLTPIPSPDEGYTVRYLSNPATGIGHAMIYIRPLQKSIVLECIPTSLQHQGPLTRCLTCDKDFPLNQMRNHIAKCPCLPSVAAASSVDTQSEQAVNTSSRTEEPSCSISEPRTEKQSSSCSISEAVKVPLDLDWKSEPDAAKAAELYKSKLLYENENKKAILLRMDLRDSAEDHQRSLISTYKAPKTEWASPLNWDAAVGEGVNRFFLSKAMTLLQFGLHINFGNTSLTRMFDGEPDHLTPSTAQFLLDSDMFLVAGRMLGHSFLHSGPCLSGLSPAIVHVLFGGSPETTTIQIADCPDIDICTTIQSLEGSAELTKEEEKAVFDLALSWDLPGVTKTNRKWLHERLLFHAVISRTSRQVKQLRKGLKETMVWPLLKERADIIPTFFPRNSEAALSSHLIIQKILWPVMEEEDEEEVCLEDKCRVAGYLRFFIENASCTQLKRLLQFWTGWELLPSELALEVVSSDFPKSSTCFETLRLPAHYNDYKAFASDIQACLNSTDTGFGLI
ncbi:uncharacterized protein LOC120559389 isoform X2 [Perca fluviatilis]|uniref:uncharacterized protein LOC120559389 isoform X2 n=1 Tax=Perca fluviatilis TaxID=8168 RepID=UPI001962A840|nr:uncharacterized protein LOC120559389 isoform X2 [Perca fluviatilis]